MCVCGEKESKHAKPVADFFVVVAGWLAGLFLTSCLNEEPNSTTLRLLVVIVVTQQNAVVVLLIERIAMLESDKQNTCIEVNQCAIE